MQKTVSGSVQYPGGNFTPPAWKRTFTKTLLVMKMTLVMLTISLFSVQASGIAQEVTIRGTRLTMKEIFTSIEKQTGYVALSSKNLFESKKLLSVNAVNVPLKTFLDSLFRNKPIRYIIEDKTIVLSVRPGNSDLQNGATESKIGMIELAEMPPFRLRVLDSLGQPLVGATITLRGNRRSAVTNSDGIVSFDVKEGDVLLISYIGYTTYEFRIGKDFDDTEAEIRLRPGNNAMSEVVISSGFINRRAESFTGSAVTVTREELLRVGNQNILQSLKNIDPAFQIVENMNMGSNPNNLPNIQLRGQNSLPNLQGDLSGNPNVPLFILDGFETTLQRVFDLNMNRVATVTILKDAAAKAIYGSRAANGVIVIETIKPVSGKLRVSYSGDLTVEVPDLTGYNLMGAAEKLAFEKERGMYFKYLQGAADAQQRDAIYKQNYDNVLKGVNTYWLSQPLRTGIGNKHAINLEGGDSRMRYQAGVTYNKIAGVMVGSERNTLGLVNTLSYTYRNLVFRNSIEYNRNWSRNSPYGAFSDYVAINQYYQPFDENGNPVKILGQNALGNVFNPLYNGSINTKSQTGYGDFTNNFNLDWKISNAFRATGNISYIRNDNTGDEFYPASHTRFVEYDANGLTDRKGSYTQTSGFYQFINSNIGLNFNKKFGKHLLFTNATWNLTSRRTVTSGMTAEGFGNDNVDNISFASMYQFNGKPFGTDNRVREIGLVGILNYSFDDRFLFDASIRSSGSSMYGSKSRWGNFWSVGAGWNLHRESIFRELGWLTQLRLRSSIGYTGSQNFDPFQSRARYQYGDIVYNSRLGAELLGLPNNALKWQRTNDLNTGLDIAIRNFLTARLEYFVSNTTDLLSDLTVAPSMGFDSYKENFGETQNKGFEFSLGITPWRNNKTRSWLTFSFSGMHYENKLLKIYDAFTSWNDAQDEAKNQVPDTQDYDEAALKLAYTRPSTYFYEGQSMNAIWGVRSLGIDPVTGEEMFLNKDGKSTWVWTTADQKVIGDVTPTLRGNVGFNAGYKGFTLAIACTYKFGGEMYNTTLIDRVENVTGYNNLDRRILDSWRQPGDIAPYRVLNISAGTTPVYTRPTSRFVQRDDELYVSSLNFGYEFLNKAWMKTTGMDRLRVSFYMNELLRMSSVQIERGTSYPFARNFSLMIQAGF